MLIDLRVFRSILLLFAFTVFLCGYHAFAQEGAQQTFLVSKTPGFSNPRAVLQKLVTRKGKARRNSFCVIGYQFPDGDKSAWVYWREGKAIILWEPTENDINDLTLSRRYLRLTKDVVENESQVQGSTYLVTRQWVNSLLRDCQARGEKFTVSK